MCIVSEMIDPTLQLAEDIVIGRVTRDARLILGDEMVADLMRRGLTEDQIHHLAERHPSQSAAIIESCHNT